MNTNSVSELLNNNPTLGTSIVIKGWVRTFRANRFIALNDGSCLANIQCVVDFATLEENLLKRITTGSCIRIEGQLVKSQGAGQNIEIQVDNISILGDSNPEEYPIQPKKHSFEFLRENAHLRIRTNTFGAVMRIRAALSYAVHHYFYQNGFFNFHAPIITGSDAEGAGEMFTVTTLDAKEKNPSFENDFFGKQTHLTVSGQLEAETYALALGKVYTFGPTFRSENSNTSRHLAEFWMVEPEMAFYNLDDTMNLAEDFIKSVLSFILKNNEADLQFLNDRFVKEDQQKPQQLRSEKSLIEKLTFVVNNQFKRVNYTEAFEILKNSKPNKKKKFENLIDSWGVDLQSEHERYLVEKHFNSPVIIFDYPAKIKAFYMRLNDDQKTVRAMDVLFPGIGEIIGGSQREERYDVLLNKIETMKIDKKELWWYLDTRKFGTTEHSGFGLGFERLVQFATGMGNIRDVIPFPRTPQNASF